MADLRAPSLIAGLFTLAQLACNFSSSIYLPLPLPLPPGGAWIAGLFTSACDLPSLPLPLSSLPLPPGGAWSSTCSPLSWDSGTGALVAACAGFATAVNYTLCAPGATLASTNGILACSSVAAGMPSESRSV